MGSEVLCEEETSMTPLVAATASIFRQQTKATYKEMDIAIVWGPCFCGRCFISDHRAILNINQYRADVTHRIFRKKDSLNKLCYAWQTSAHSTSPIFTRCHHQYSAAIFGPKKQTWLQRVPPTTIPCSCYGADVKSTDVNKSQSRCI